MFNVGGGEMLAVLLLALLVLGPDRLPKAMAEVGKWVGQLRRMSSGFQDELKKAMDAANAPGDADGDSPFGPGDEARPALPPGVEEEVRVVHRADPEVEPRAPLDDGPSAPVDVDATEDAATEGAATGAVAAGEAEPAGREASVTPLNPRR